MTDLEQTLQARLLDTQDPAYRDFQRRLIPTLPPEAIIGVRLPQLRAMAKELSGTPEGAQFLKILPHRYYEENNLHAYLIERIRDYDQVIACLLYTSISAALYSLPLLTVTIPESVNGCFIITGENDVGSGSIIKNTLASCFIAAKSVCFLNPLASFFLY